MRSRSRKRQCVACVASGLRQRARARKCSARAGKQTCGARIVAHPGPPHAYFLAPCPRRHPLIFLGRAACSGVREAWSTGARQKVPTPDEKMDACKGGGRCFEQKRTNLSWSNLSWSNLCCSNLSWSNLSWSNLSWSEPTNLSWSDPKTTKFPPPVAGLSDSTTQEEDREPLTAELLQAAELLQPEPLLVGVATGNNVGNQRAVGHEPALLHLLQPVSTTSATAKRRLRPCATANARAHVIRDWLPSMSAVHVL